jgi:glycosyltransferase involved in cell wall biosynthesis
MPGARESSESIRILRVIARLNMGGPALHVSYLAGGLEARGYRTTLVSGSLSRGEGSMSYIAEERGVKLVSVPQLSRELSPPNDFVAVRRLVQLMHRERPHILHTHTAKAGAIGRLAARLAGGARPPIVVHTFHGHVLRGYFGQLPSEAYRRIERLLARHTDRLIAVSPEVRDDLVELGVARREKFEIVRLGIELDERLSAADHALDYRHVLGIPESAFVVGWIGRMTEIKQVPEVLRIFAKLRELGVDARLCIVGDGPAREDAERRANELGVMRECLFLGYHRDVASFYRVFDAFLLPSANEGTPVSAIESLAAERPVVATAVGGVPDVVVDGVHGRLFRPGDVDVAALALKELAEDPDLRRRMGEAGRGWVVPRYSVDRLVDDIDRLYRSLLESKGLPSPELESSSPATSRP